MAENRGKQFEDVIRQAFLDTPDTSVIRMPDPMMGYAGVKNFCDFIVYHRPYQFFIECKSVHGNTFPFSNITKNQWEGLLGVDRINGVVAGIMCWWVDRDVTGFLDIGDLHYIRDICKEKSIRYDAGTFPIIKGKKKRVFFNYDMEAFFNEL